jgi:hypothetical protein
MKFFGNQDLKKYQILNLVVDKGPAFPLAYEQGQLFFRTDQDVLYLRLSSAWKNIMTP